MYIYIWSIDRVVRSSMDPLRASRRTGMYPLESIYIYPRQQTTHWRYGSFSGVSRLLQKHTHTHLSTFFIHAHTHTCIYTESVSILCTPRKYGTGWIRLIVCVDFVWSVKAQLYSKWLTHHPSENATTEIIINNSLVVFAVSFFVFFFLLGGARWPTIVVSERAKTV